MEDIHLDGTPTTPVVNFLPSRGTFELSGRSIPENAAEFYKPLIECLDSYAQSKSLPPTQVDIKLEYYNTATSRCLLDIFKKLDAMKKSGTEVTVDWYYEEDDDDMRDAGEYYQTLVSVGFNFKPV
ncbi:MAG: DUF1987 domain-containing protein [Bacteroidia bacterium]|nr:DUF1987 domain-containing protein [Bacteroidia bacterium]